MVKKWRVFLGSSCMRRPEPGNAVYIIYGYFPGLRSPHRVFLRSFRENRSFFEKKRKPCLSPHARGFLFYVLILYGVRVFEILRFFMKTPGWVIHGFRRYTLHVSMYIYLWFFLFLIFIEVKSEICEEHEAMQIHEPFFLKKGSCVRISSENGRAHEPESEITFRLVSPSNLLRDMNAWALF